jgi:hypothetical protein
VAVQKVSAGERLVQASGVGDFSRCSHRFDKPIVVVVEVCQGRVDVFRPEIWMLAQDLFGRPAVVIVLAREMDDLVPRVFDTYCAVLVERQVWILGRRAHGVEFQCGAGRRTVAAADLITGAKDDVLPAVQSQAPENSSSACTA